MPRLVKNIRPFTGRSNKISDDSATPFLKAGKPSPFVGLCIELYMMREQTEGKATLNT